MPARDLRASLTSHRRPRAPTGPTDGRARPHPPTSRRRCGRGRRPSRRAGRRPAVAGSRSWLSACCVGLVLLGVCVWWLAAGLLDASRTVQDKAAVAQTRARAVPRHAQGRRRGGGARPPAGGRDGAGRGRGGRRRRARCGSPSTCRTSGARSPTSTTCSPPPAIMTGSGRATRSTSTRTSPATTPSSSRTASFSIPAIREAQGSVETIEASLDRRRGRARAGDGHGPKGGDALEKKKSALKQITLAAAARSSPLGPLLDAMPDAVGAERHEDATSSRS